MIYTSYHVSVYVFIQFTPWMAKLYGCNFLVDRFSKNHLYVSKELWRSLSTAFQVIWLRPAGFGESFWTDIAPQSISKVSNIKAKGATIAVLSSSRSSYFNLTVSFAGSFTRDLASIWSNSCTSCS